MPINVPIIGSGPSGGSGSDFTLGSNPIEPPAGDYTVPSNLTSSVIIVDNDAAGRDVDFPAAMDTNGLYVIVPKSDPNTNNVTVSVNGVLQYTINQPNGAVGIQYLGASYGYRFIQEWDTIWEIDPTTNEITAQLPLTVVASAIQPGTDSTEYTSDQESDYTNLQSNVSWASTGLFNNVTDGTDFATTTQGASIGASSNWSTVTALITGASSGPAICSSVNFGDGNNSFQIDFGASRTINKVALYNGISAGLGIVDTIKVEVSTDAFAANVTNVGTITMTREGNLNAFYDIYGALLGGSYVCNSIRITLLTIAGSELNVQWSEFFAFNATAATTGNTADTEIYNGSAASFDLAGSVFKNPQGTDLVDGEITIDYATNGGAFTGTQLSLNDFKAIGVLSSITQLDLRVQPVGFVGITTSTVKTPSSSVRIDENGNVIIAATGVNVLTADATGRCTVRTFANDYVETTETTVTVSSMYGSYFLDATSGNVTVNLPTLASVDKAIFTIKKVDVSANTVTIDGNGAETIDGAATKVLTSQWEVVKIQATASGWRIVN